MITIDFPEDIITYDEIKGRVYIENKLGRQKQLKKICGVRTTMADGNSVRTMRLIYECIYGPLANYVDVYPIDGDESNHHIRNIATRDAGPSKPSLWRVAKEAMETNAARTP